MKLKKGNLADRIAGKSKLTQDMVNDFDKIVKREANISEEKKRMADLIEEERKQATIFEILISIAMVLMVLAMLVVPVFIAGFVIGRWL